MRIKAIILLLLLVFIGSKPSSASFILIPMDETQLNHLKAYGLTYWVLENETEAQWLLNYRGGSFMMKYNKVIEDELIIRGISYEIIADSRSSAILNEIIDPEVNMDVVKLEKAPKIAVYSPKNKQPWDDAVTLVLTYSEIPYDVVYDEEIIYDKLNDYDWLHLHHEDFTGQYGKFYGSYHNQAWYKEQVRFNEEMAKKLGFEKVSELKRGVALKINDYTFNGGFLFSMCSGTDSYDIALAAKEMDICEYMYDGDGSTPNYNNQLNFENTFAFYNFILKTNPLEYEFSDIDGTPLHNNLTEREDKFTLFNFSAKWDPIPTMLCQNHTNVINGFMGQTTDYLKKLIKPNVLVLGENKALNTARYIHGKHGQGTWTFYGGHDPEDYRHYVGDSPTDLSLHSTSPGYRLILNNILFPAAKKKKQKT